ncbi:hypothetical protein H2204_005351 [Knufia peltigerae]|uniref:Uncharacterized protein n=1 Tax=Knufia peltigerae TaxID=1002370 RepID=A0AA38Y732_9EURO|nr:hypothetical protein H2204_005351 [Knufia peltigerae]
MPDKPQNSKDNSIPPPLDPFPTYQTPFPRSNRDDDNPFIQFRRFADEQFSSMFQGIPRLLGFQSNRHFEDMIRERQEREEGWRKQIEQEMEEWRQNREELMQRLTQRLENNIPERIEQIRQHRERMRRMEDAEKSSEESTQPLPQITPWSARDAASKCPASNGSQHLQGRPKCHAWRNRNEQARTELDAYETLEHDSLAPNVPGIQSGSDDTRRQRSKSWFSSFGWDGRKIEQGRDKDDSKRVPLECEERSSQPVTYTMFSTKSMDPFDDTSVTMPWLMLNKYSPIYLCNPSQPRMYEVQLHDAEDVPFRISRPRFFEPSPRHHEFNERLAKQLPWADAFEDLISLQQTGRMVDRDYSTWRTPSTWIHDMVYRGSLGPRWAFNHDGMLIRRSVDAETRARQQGQRYGWHDGFAGQSSLLLGRKVSEFLDEMGDNVTKTIATSPMFSSVLSAANAIVSAAEEAQRDFESMAPETVDERGEESRQTQDAEVVSEQVRSTAFSHAFESSFSSSINQGGTENQVVGTTTSISQRTLPDGSVETKRIFNRRFADGTTESEESVDVSHGPAAQPRPLYGDQANEQLETGTAPAASFHSEDGEGHGSIPRSERQRQETTDGATQGQTENSTEQPKRGGWFWT